MPNWVACDAGGAKVQTLHFEISWDGFGTTDGAGASLIALAFGNDISRVWWVALDILGAHMVES